MQSDPHSSPRFNWGLSYARGYFHLGMLHEAHDELAALSDADKKHPEVLKLEGLILLARRRWVKTVEHCALASEYHPEVPDFYVQAAYAYEKLGLPEEARLFWERAPESVCKTPTYHYHLARAEMALGNENAAKAHALKAIKLSPDMRATIGNDTRLAALLDPITTRPSGNSK